MQDYVDEMHSWIESVGWEPGRQRRENNTWYRRVMVKPQCYKNTSRPGIQVELREFDFRQHEGGGVSYTVSIVGKPDSGAWVDFKCYGIGIKELKNSLDKEVGKFARAWVACQTGEVDEHDD